MRSHLLNYEDRQFIHYVIFVCHDVCCRICSYCKLSYRKCIPSAQKILLYIRLVLLRIRIVVTCIVRYFSILKCKLEIHIFQAVQEYFTYV